MKKLKNILGILGVLVISLLLVGCGNNENIEGDLTSLIDKLYEGIKEDERPMLMTTTLDDETFESFAFVKDVDYKEAVVSEPPMSSIPHSVVLIRLNDANDASKVVADIKANANPRKWFCVEAENVIVKSRGDLVILIMSNELAAPIEKNFDNL